MLRLGSRGPEVARLQRYLNHRVNPSPPLVVDGVFGPKTQEAVRGFQRSERLVPDGIVGRRTAAALGLELARKVASVFADARIDRIDFHLDGLHISPERLRSVGDAIGNGRIPVVVASTGSLLGAAYSPHPNTLTLPDDNVPGTVSRQAAIVHEGVHALVDMYHLVTTVLNDEALGYLAEVIYWRAAHTWVRGSSAAMSIYNSADAIAQSHGLYQTRGVQLSFQDAEPLRQAIHAHPAYQSIHPEQRTSGHGVP